MGDGDSESDAVKLGLLMEAARTQLRLGEETLAHLREHLRTLDAMVRAEVSRAAIETFDNLRAETDEVARALRRLQRASSLRWVLLSTVTAMVSAAIALTAVRMVVPSVREIAALRARRAKFVVDIRRLRENDGAVDLRRCGTNGKLCVRVYRSGPTYGPYGDFLLVKAP